MDRVVWVYLNIDHNDEIGLTCEKTFPSSLKDKEEMEVKLSFKPAISNDKYIIQNIKIKLFFDLKSEEKRN